MTVNQFIRMFAGFMVLLSVSLGAPGSPLFVSPWWLALTAFVGFNLLQSSFTHFCPLEKVLRKLGVRDSCETC